MLTVHRWVPALVVTAVILTLLFQANLYRQRLDSPVSQQLPIEPQKVSDEPPQALDDFGPSVPTAHSRWSDRVQHYPVTQLTQLPSEKPKRLPPIQYAFLHESEDSRTVRVQRRDAVKKTFQRCWQTYKTSAWMKDELAPISGGGRDAFGGWSATLVDALDTLWIMDLTSEFSIAAAAAMNINFSTSTDETINVFETTIRYLGGFLAAYDLSGSQGMLRKAIEVGEMLLVPFDTPNHFPISRWKWKMAVEGSRQVTPDWMLLSELGSLSLEFTRLSQLTDDMRWFHAVDRITKLLEEQQMQTKLPGLWPIVVDPRNENLTSDTGFTFGGMSDSTYEYLPKQFALLGGVSPEYQTMYERSMATAADALFFRPMTPNGDDILISGDARVADDGSTVKLTPLGQHLGCFAGGMLALGGRIFSNQDHIALGRKLTDGCVWAYKAMERGIMPEIARFVPCESKNTCAWDVKKWHAAVLAEPNPAGEVPLAEEVIKQKHLPEGYADVLDKRYILRPEAIESVFIMYRITGDTKYQDIAWEMFNAINDISNTEFANAAIVDITRPKSNGEAPKQNRMESFWLAETLKYFYLIFSEPGLVSLDKYVLNTEAHPLRRPE